jgi:hypothetical protein
LQINFPDEIEAITLTISAKSPLMAWWNIDWVTGNFNLPPLTYNFKLYAGRYFIVQPAGATFVPDAYLTIPLDTINWEHVKTYTEGGTNYTWTFSGPRYTPPTGSVIWQE